MEKISPGREKVICEYFFPSSSNFPEKPILPTHLILSPFTFFSDSHDLDQSEEESKDRNFEAKSISKNQFYFFQKLIQFKYWQPTIKIVIF